MIRRILNKLESIYYYRYFSNVKHGATNTLLKKIYKSTDILFIEKVFQLDFFREIIDPLPLQIQTLKNVLVIAPHQDDEVIGLGGTLLKLKNVECSVTLVFLTDGANALNPSETKKIRSEEAKKVALKLNADCIEIGIPNNTMEIKCEHLEQMVSVFNSKKWDSVFTVWPMDYPPKHRICALFVQKALTKVKKPAFSMFLYSVHTEIIPNFFVDITSEEAEKQELLSCYESQLVAQAYDHLTIARDAWSSRFLSVSKEKRYVEVFFKVNIDEYNKIISIFHNVNTHELFKGHEICINSYNLFLK
ncbi:MULTISPECIES: PIG-L deacetylase family protein [Flavobacterium]|uniref:PIG-L family deacetylase n=1 Tax=Flavobacterium hankyongi TaxID=1176532 RepID=A0ABP9A2A2_9FLAO|nr:PIG-L family deacetylase [Flavobacterium sp. N1846]